MYEQEYLTITSFNYRINLPDKPKTVIINSNGGSNQFATPVYDWIRLHKVNTIAEGTCQSFGFMIFTAGEKRYSYPSTIFMQHGGNANHDSKRNKKLAMDKFNEIFYKPWLDRMMQISNKPRSFWEETLKDPDKHFYWSAKELKEMGVVTHIIGE